jgi:epsilon-lactone hydrolase
MFARIHFRGTVQNRLRHAAELGQSIAEVSVRRMLKGPKRTSWNWFIELGTELLKKQLIAAFKMPDVKAARQYLDSIQISSRAISEVEITPLEQTTFRGSWFTPINTEPHVTVLYFHGGGYAFYPRGYNNFIALIALATKSRTFALDYRLSPENRFPAQLDDALNAYRWLLGTGTEADHIVLAGDSAGGHLAVALLLAARDFGLSAPALTITLSPPTDFETEYPSIVGNQDLDWINKQMLTQWADWFCDPAQRHDPRVSPLWADLRGLPPIYIQAGGGEILYHSIRAFADRAKSDGADVVLETWEDMNHVFQMFGPDVLQSAEALRRIGEVVDLRVRRGKSTPTTIRKEPYAVPQ